MLTDDDLGQELRSAFLAGTNDLSYQGRTRPRRTAVVAVPAVAVGVSLAALAITTAVNGGADPAPAVPQAGGPSTSVHPSHAPLVTDTIQVAGYTFHYQRAATGGEAPLVASVATSVPDGLKPISAPDGVKAWVGKDPRGDNAIYVQVSAARGGPSLFELHSSSWTQDQLVEMFHDGTPRTVPLVKE